MTNQEFLDAVNQLAADADRAGKDVAKILSVVDSLKTLFDENRAVAYEVGVDNSMSYHDNPVEQVGRCLKYALSEHRADFWLPSSWAQC